MSKQYEKRIVNVDPWPFRLGQTRVANPGTLNGERLVYDPRPEFDRVTWAEMQS